MLDALLEHVHGGAVHVCNVTNIYDQHVAACASVTRGGSRNFNMVGL